MLAVLPPVRHANGSASGVMTVAAARFDAGPNSTGATPLRTYESASIKDSPMAVGASYFTDSVRSSVTTTGTTDDAGADRCASKLAAAVIALTSPATGG